MFAVSRYAVEVRFAGSNYQSRNQTYTSSWIIKAHPKSHLFQPLIPFIGQMKVLEVIAKNQFSAVSTRIRISLYSHWFYLRNLSSVSTIIELRIGFQDVAPAELNLTISSHSMLPSASQNVPINSKVNLLTTLAYSCINSSFFSFA